MDELKPPPMSDAEIAKSMADADWPPSLIAPMVKTKLKQFAREVIAARDAQWLSIVGELQRDAAAALGLLARMRAACGDNGVRMQDELEQYLRELVGDAARYRWLRHGDNDAKVIQRGPVAHDYVYLPRNAKLDEMIDAALSSEGKGAEG